MGHGEWNDRLFEKIWWYRSFSVTWSAALQIAWNKGKSQHVKGVQFPQDFLCTQTWPPIHCFVHKYGRRDVM